MEEIQLLYFLEVLLCNFFSMDFAMFPHDDFF